MENLQGQKVGRYTIAASIGHGNRASVYQATETGTGQMVAIRLFDRALTADSTFAGRFRQLEEMLSTVQHPHLLPITDFGEHEGQAYIVRPFIAGGSLRRLLGRPMPVDRVLHHLRPVADALDYAHERGLVHGDVKPGNILLPHAGPVLLVDLGVAQLLPRGSSLLMTATGRYYGTPEYLSPEQAHGLPLDRRTDEYALSTILYEALAGRPPFRAESPADTPRTIAARHITAALPPLRQWNPALSAAVEQVVLRGLDKDPDRRFPSCGDLLAAFEDVTVGDMVTTSVLVAPPPQPAPTRAFEPTETRRSGTLLLESAQPWEADREHVTVERLVAQHAADIQALTAGYEAQLAAHTEVLARQESTIAALTDQLVTAHEEQGRLAADREALLAIVQERDQLLVRVQELEQAAVLAQPWPDVEPFQPLEVAAPVATIGQLTIQAAPQFDFHAGGTFTIFSGSTIGRHPACEVQISDNFVSTRHARLTKDEDGWWITDLGTTNGTYVNETRIHNPARIRHGDALRFGRIRASFS